MAPEAQTANPTFVPPPRARQPRSVRSVRDAFARNKILALIVAIVVVGAFFSYMTGGDFTLPRNLSNLLRQMAITGMLACGMSFVIISGEIDLSVGSLLGLLGGVAALLDVAHVPAYATVPIVLLCGAAVGAFNGFWVAYLNIPSFIVGLAGMLTFRGIVIGVTGGETIAPVSQALVRIGQSYVPLRIGDACAVVLFGVLAVTTWRTHQRRLAVGLATAPAWQVYLRIALYAAVIGGFMVVLDSYEGVPFPVLILLSVAGIFSFVSRQTVFGRRIYAIGGNLEATRLSGVDVRLNKLVIFAIMGTMAALAGLITTARLAAGTPSAGSLGELDAISSCIIGGTSMRGGAGTVAGALFGALFMASLDNGMSMMGLDTFWQMIVKGVILLLAVWLDIATSARR
ncbi:sugar ABC transporter permease [Tanticharoenia sakaeratensis]|uniref:Xylose transport system permease protein XylH n=1 Tax=Tanticharoenia sakaeratensis NBRC 103193 TaxID=1231623 RepID=A0A0D6ML02_9PROT|nr:sugar ABC transporter permease [Tanticharoenia sakaeratensis]GAN53953.1 xylose ABC transporter permease xylH [Tanticharoenia sakaeratensis NBRC 103193]GBQ25347.1 D-xylose ABC transporter permease [Tanticharoenia sakaeratensis NBRC 103193]